ncbi:hypothetical protein VspSTUT16_29280 [Vibrio sp. STUT-A16]|nr:hypothetical protein VspSTUT16_29280 [Vibrio sp. STUT-A16]
MIIKVITNNESIFRCEPNKSADTLMAIKCTIYAEKLTLPINIINPLTRIFVGLMLTKTPKSKKEKATT